MKLDSTLVKIFLAGRCYEFAAKILDLPVPCQLNIVAHDDYHPMRPKAIATFDVNQIPTIRVARVGTSSASVIVEAFFHEIVHYAQYLHDFDCDWKLMLEFSNSFEYEKNPLELEAVVGAETLYKSFMNSLKYQYK